MEDISKISFKTYLEDQQLNPTTVGRYNDVKRQFEKFAQRKNINKYTVSNFLRATTNTNQKRSALKKIFEYWNNQDMISLQEMIELTMSIPKVKGRRLRIPEYLEVFEIKKLMNHKETTAQIRTAIRLMYENGLRASELCGLTVSNANLISKRLRFIGKGNKETEVPISNNAVEELKILTLNKHPSEEIFWKMGTKKFNRKNLWKEIKRLGEVVLDKPIHPHIFRHSLGTELHRRGVSLLNIQQIMRHESIITTSIYSHTVKTDVDEDWLKTISR